MLRSQHVPMTPPFTSIVLLSAGALAVTLLACGPVTAPAPQAAETLPEPSPGDASTEQSTPLPSVSVHPQTVDEAFSYVWGLLGRMDFFQANNYRVSLPDHPAFTPFINGKSPLQDSQRQKLRNTFAQEVYRTADFAAAQSAFDGMEPRIAPALKAFQEMERQWGFRVFPHYKVQLTLYGPGGSYDPNKGVVTMRVTPDGQFRASPIMVVVHELVHIGIEHRIVSQYGLEHWEKERLVDLICSIKFRELFPDYSLQSMGDERLDGFVDDEAIDDLPRAIEAYVRAHPRAETEPEPTVPPAAECEQECSWGMHCAAGTCAEAECHPAFLDLPERRCTEGQHCNYDNAVAAGWGVGRCQPQGSPSALAIELPSRAQGCVGLADCNWGFSCPHLGGLCVEAECHPAAPGGGLPERQCDDGQDCEYGDDMGHRWGTGVCLPDDG